MENWRSDLSVHPAADLFPLMSEAELRELGEDIKKNGLQSPIIVMSGPGIDDDAGGPGLERSEPRQDADGKPESPCQRSAHGHPL